MGACNAKSVRMERERGTVVSAWILYVSHGKADLTAACIMQETVYRINSTEPMNAKCSVGEATYSCPTWVYFRTCKNLYADSMFHLLHLTFPEDLKSLIPTWSPLMLRLGTSEVTSSSIESIKQMGKLDILKYFVFLFMNMKYFSIDLLWFLPWEICSFLT